MCCLFAVGPTDGPGRARVWPQLDEPQVANSHLVSGIMVCSLPCHSEVGVCPAAEGFVGSSRDCSRDTDVELPANGASSFPCDCRTVTKSYLMVEGVVSLVVVEK